MALNDSNYPAGTYEADPRAPWNKPTLECQDCKYCMQVALDSYCEPDYDGNKTWVCTLDIQTDKALNYLPKISPDDEACGDCEVNQ